MLTHLTSRDNLTILLVDQEIRQSVVCWLVHADRVHESVRLDRVEQGNVRVADGIVVTRLDGRDSEQHDDRDRRG